MDSVTFRKAATLKGLEEILIPDLELGECAEGKTIFGVLSAEAELLQDPKCSILSKVRDVWGNEMPIKVGFAVKHDGGQQGVDAAYPKGARVAIKEPFLLPPEPQIDVCNPPCIEFLGVDDALIDGDGPCELRMKGNMEFRRHNFLMASLYYGECLRELHGVPEMEKDRMMALSNRAQAYLNLGRLDDALVDAKMAVEIDPHHSKSLARMAKAFGGMQDHQRAVEYLERALEHCPLDEAADIQHNLDKSRALLKQSFDGIFDISDFILGGRKHDMAPPLSDFVGPLEVRFAGEAGKGLFLTEDVRIGDVLIASNLLGGAMASPAGDRLSNEHAKVLLDIDAVVELIRACTGSYRLNLQLRGLVVDDFVPDMSAYRPNSVLYRPPEDKDEDFYSALSPEWIVPLICKYTLAAPDNRGRPHWCGIWGLPGFINHSCVPNVSIQVVGRALIVRAARDIKAGDELVQSYMNCSWPLSMRRETMSEHNFCCKCWRCTIESELAEMLEKNMLIKTWAAQPKMGMDVYMDDLRAALEHIERVLAATELSSEEKDWVRGSFAELCKAPGVIPPEEAMRLLRARAAGFPLTIYKLLAIYTSMPKPSVEASNILEEECVALYGRLPGVLLDRIVRNLLQDRVV